MCGSVADVVLNSAQACCPFYVGDDDKPQCDKSVAAESNVVFPLVLYSCNLLTGKPRVKLSAVCLFTKHGRLPIY